MQMVSMFIELELIKRFFFERFSNDKAHAQHVKNVSAGGCLEEAFGKIK